MTVYVILVLVAVAVGMAIAVAAFGTGGKRKRIFQDIYFGVEEQDGVGVIYTKTGECSAVLKMENPVMKYSANAESYYEFAHLFEAIMQTLGEGYALHKQDVLTRERFHEEGSLDGEGAHGRNIASLVPNGSDSREGINPSDGFCGSAMLAGGNRAAKGGGVQNVASLVLNGSNGREENNPSDGFCGSAALAGGNRAAKGGGVQNVASLVPNGSDGREGNNSVGCDREFLSRAYFRYFEGRSYTDCATYLVITQEAKKSSLFSYDQKRWKDFMVKVRKVKDQLRDAGVRAEFLSKKEASDYVDRFFAMDFSSPTVMMNNVKVDDEMIGMGDKRCKIFSLVDVDTVNLPGVIRPFTNVEVNNASMPIDLMGMIDQIPEAQTVVYNQIVYMPNQKHELAMLEKKKNRHASMPNPANMMAVEDIKRVQEVIARESKQIVYSHFNLMVCCDKGVDMQKPTNHLENAFGRMGIHISKRAYNQLELFVNSFPGNCYGMNADYDRFMTLSDAATCLMYKERMLHSEDTPLKIYYTDRQGVPIAIDISGKEGRNKLTDNSNFFCLGPSGSGKSFHINSVMRQMHEQGTDVVMVDTGNSYEGLCEYLGGKYISYTEEKPITMNPFKIKREELNIEKINFLKNLILQIWKGSNGVVSKTEERLIGQVIDEYYKRHFSGQMTDGLSFNTFFEFARERVPEIIEENGLHGIDVADLNYQLRDFYKGGSHETTLNENMDSTLFDETFIVFEIDAIKDDPTLFPIVTLIIMDVFLQKMRLKKNRKVLVIEEAWKAIATPLMAEYIRYLYKTARKFWASVGVVTQEIQDIIGSEIVKEAIINNSDVVMLLDQSKFKERFDDIKAILGLTEVDCKKIFTINRLENKDGRSFFREVFVRRGSVSGVYGVEEPRECYMTYTTERAEKEALKLYKAEMKCSHQEAIEAYCRDWALSGIGKSLEFAQRVNRAGKVLHLG